MIMNNCASFVAAVLLALTASQASAVNSYPLKCRSGGNIQLAFDSSTGAWLRFAKAPGGYDSVALLPGECSWADRALNADESPALNQASVGNVNIQWGVNFTSYGAGAAAPWMRAMTLDDNHYVTFQVYNRDQTLTIVGSAVD